MDCTVLQHNVMPFVAVICHFMHCDMFLLVTSSFKGFFHLNLLLLIAQPSSTICTGCSLSFPCTLHLILLKFSFSLTPFVLCHSCTTTLSIQWSTRALFVSTFHMCFAFTDYLARPYIDYFYHLVLYSGYYTFKMPASHCRVGHLSNKSHRLVL